MIGTFNYEEWIQRINPDFIWYFAQHDRYKFYTGEWFAVGVSSFNQWVFHNGSYGSCSGCDWLHSISTVEDAIIFLKAMSMVQVIAYSRRTAIDYLRRERENKWEKASVVIGKLIRSILTSYNIG